MNIKNIAIVLTVLMVGIAAMLFMQKGNYVKQAKESYEATTKTSYDNTVNAINLVNTAAGTTKMLWAMTSEAIQEAKTSQDMAKLEAKYFPATKGSNSISQKTRRFEAAVGSPYYIVTTFDKVDEDKKNNLKTLAGIKSIDVSALLGNPTVAVEEEEGEEEAEEVEEAPAPKKQAKKGKKGKKR
ncbi:MAG: hypothetical protein J6S81_09585 [Treponema sp.]|nr:hypothetical protein [Treponema sp.]